MTGVNSTLVFGRRLKTDAAISGCWRTKDSEIAAAFTPFKLRKDIKEELPPDYDAWTLRFSKCPVPC